MKKGLRERVLQKRLQNRLKNMPGAYRAPPPTQVAVPAVQVAAAPQSSMRFAGKGDEE